MAQGTARGGGASRPDRRWGLPPLALAAMLATPAPAQRPPATNAPAASAATAGTPTPAEQRDAAPSSDMPTDEIVVTAQFREQRLQDVPIAISAVNSQMLEQRAVRDLTEVARAVPNVQMTTGSSGFGSSTNQAFIRGLGQADFLTTFEPRVGFYIDDVYFSTTFGAVFDSLDLERVEVLRGPQGTLFGRNSVGGAIRIITKKPVGDGSGYLEATGGSYARRQVKGSIDLGLVPDTLAIRLSANYRAQDGWVKLLSFRCANPTLGNNNLQAVGRGPVNGGSCRRDTLGGDENFVTRGSLRWTPGGPGGAVEVLLSGDYQDDRSESSAERIVQVSTSLQNPETGVLGSAPRAAFPVANDNGLARYLRDPARGGFYGFTGSDPALLAALIPPDRYATYASYGNRRVGFDNPPDGRLKSYGFSGTVDADLAEHVHLTSITAYRRYSGEFGQSLLALPVEEVRQGVRHHQFSQEVRLLGGLFENRLNYTLGAFYIDAKSRNPARIQTEGFTNALDFFGNDPSSLRSYAFFGQLEFRPVPPLTLAAGVRYSDEKKSYTFDRDYSPSGLAAINFVATGRSHDTRANPRFSATWAVTPAINVYAAYATGFTAGGFNARPFNRTDVFAIGPEDVTTWEAGIKTQLFERRLRLNVAAYTTRFEDIQLMLRGGVGARTTSPFYYDNGGDARIKGFEAEFEAHPVRALLVSGSVGYTRFRYTSLASNVGNLFLDSPPQRVPSWTTNGSVQYDLDLGRLGKLTPRFDVSYYSRLYFSNFRNNVSAQQPGYAIANARLTWTPNKAWAVSIGSTNLFDKFYYTYLVDQRESFGFTSGSVGRPRESYISVRRNF